MIEWWVVQKDVCMLNYKTLLPTWDKLENDDIYKKKRVVKLDCGVDENHKFWRGVNFSFSEETIQS